MLVKFYKQMCCKGKGDRVVRYNLGFRPQILDVEPLTPLKASVVSLVQEVNTSLYRIRLQILYEAPDKDQYFSSLIIQINSALYI